MVKQYSGYFMRALHIGVTLELVESEWSILPFIMWVGLIQSVEGLTKTKQGPLLSERGFCQ